MDSPATFSRPAFKQSRARWLGHLFFLTAWIAIIVAQAYFHGLPGGWYMPIRSSSDLLRREAVNIVAIAAVFLGAWVCSRALADQWRLRWKGGLGPLWRGLLLSFALRLAIGAVLFAAVFAVKLVHGVNSAFIRGLVPKIEHSISFKAFASDPMFFWLVTILLSAIAGLAEEIWRGGMLAGLAGAFPRAFGGRVGQWTAIIPIAALFGLGHLQMGWGAVAETAVIGLGLGAIIVWRQTVWDAVVAHALFDAASFVGLLTVLHRHPGMLHAS